MLVGLAQLTVLTLGQVISSIHLLCNRNYIRRYRGYLLIRRLTKKPTTRITIQTGLKMPIQIAA